MRIVLPLLVLALLAGCFGGDPAPNERTFSASSGVVRAGWGYDGGSVLAQDATLQGMTNDADNTGSVEVSFLLDGAEWAIRFDRFAQAQDRAFMDGGVEHELDEHGDTGVADASIPKIHALVAAWGSASVTRAGALVTQEPWSAHLMVSGDTVRGPDGKIAKADGATAYDPASPADARRIEGDPQALLFVKHPLGETFQRGVVGVGANLSCEGPQCAQTAEIAIDEGATQLDLNVTYAAAGPLPLAIGRATLSIADANGASVYESGEVQVAPGSAPMVVPVSSTLEGFVGPLTVSLTGDGAFAVQLAGGVTYVDHPFLQITWDEPTVS